MGKRKYQKNQKTSRLSPVVPLVDEVNQSIYAGTTIPGAIPPGVHVQDDLQYRYIDHGTHFGIVSPPANWPN
jgi:hypothetical protein